MNAFISRMGVLLMTVLVSSCVTPSSVMLDSVTVKRFETFPRKIFVLSYLESALPAPFKNGYIESMAAEFNKLGAAVVMAQVTGLELDKNIHVRQMEDFQPDLVMVVRSDLGDIWNGIYRGKIILTLIDYRDNMEAWKSLQTFRFEPYTQEIATGAGSKFASDAFQKLLHDRVFSPKKPAKAGDKFI